MYIQLGICNRHHYFNFSILPTVAAASIKGSALPLVVLGIWRMFSPCRFFLLGPDCLGHTETERTRITEALGSKPETEAGQLQSMAF